METRTKTKMEFNRPKRFIDLLYIRDYYQNMTLRMSHHNCSAVDRPSPGRSETSRLDFCTHFRERKSEDQPTRCWFVCSSGEASSYGCMLHNKLCGRSACGSKADVLSDFISSGNVRKRSRDMMSSLR
nr:hypothetical protein CFP56_74916 [Quercus suber]